MTWEGMDTASIEAGLGKEKMSLEDRGGDRDLLVTERTGRRDRGGAYYHQGTAEVAWFALVAVLHR